MSIFETIVTITRTLPGFPRIDIGEGFQPQVAKFEHDINQMQREFRDFSKPLKKSVNEVVIPSIRMNSAAGGRPPWHELAASTISKRGSAEPILIRSGRLLLVPPRATTGKSPTPLR